MKKENYDNQEVLDLSWSEPDEHDEADVADSYVMPQELLVPQGQPKKPDCQNIIESLPKIATPQKNPEPFDPWRVCSLPDALRNEGQKPSYVIDGLLMSQSATLVSAQPHGMKSLSLLGASMEAVAKHTVWGHFAAPDVDSTLFVETEDPQWLVEARIRGLAKGLGLTDQDELKGFHYACVGPFDLIGEEGRILKLIWKHAPKFIVLSTLQNLLRERNWTSQQDMQPIMASVIELSRECPIILVTHSPWDKRQKRAAGTITQAANFATTLHYEKKWSKDGQFVQVTVDSKAGALTDGFSLKLETEGPPKDPGSVRRIAFSGEGFRRGNTREVIEDAFEDNPNVSVEELMELTGTGKRNVQNYLKELKERAA
jgi:hypothetical protein